MDKGVENNAPFLEWAYSRKVKWGGGSDSLPQMVKEVSKLNDLHGLDFLDTWTLILSLSGEAFRPGQRRNLRAGI